MTFPEGWEVQNSSEAVVAKQPGFDLYMVLRMAENVRGRGLSQIAEEGMRELGYTVRSGGKTEINGLEAHIGTYVANVRNTGQVVARVAYIRQGRSLYSFGGVGPADEFARVGSEIGTSIRSFRPLSREEAEDIRPNEIALYTVHDGDTWQSIAQRGGDEIVQARTLAIMNGYPVNE